MFCAAVYLYDTPEEYAQVLSQVDEVESGLVEWSRQFPAVTFAFVEADCFGGNCEYFGFCCRDAQQLLLRDCETGGSLVELVGGVGIEITGRSSR